MPLLVLVWVRSFIKPDLFDNNVPLDNTTPMYLINLLWKLGSGIQIRLRVALFWHFSLKIGKVSTLSSANFTDSNILVTECTHIMKITYFRSARA